MNAKSLALAASMLFSTGCIVVSTDTIDAGDPIDARFLLTWTTLDAANGMTIDCFTAGADTVRVRAKNTSTGNVLTDLFDCSSRAGATYEITAGDYYVYVDLVDCRGDTSCRRPRVVSSVSRTALQPVWQEGDYDLGHFVFMVE
ncbi:MAG: hypothetical protein R3B70_00690 [Polyangiaceae bacterium]